MVMGVVVLPALPLMTPVKYCFGPTEPAWAGAAWSPTAMTARAAKPSIPDDRRRLNMLAISLLCGCSSWFPGAARLSTHGRPTPGAPLSERGRVGDHGL